MKRIDSVWKFSDSKEKELEALLDQYGLEHELGKKIFIDDYADLAFQYIAYIDEDDKGYNIEALQHAWDIITIRLHEFPKWFRKPPGVALNQFD